MPSNQFPLDLVPTRYSVVHNTAMMHIYLDFEILYFLSALFEIYGGVYLSRSILLSRKTMIAKSYSAGVAFGQTLMPAALAANIREKNETKIGVAALIGGFAYQLVANIASASNLIQPQS
ncbi:MAG TPA: hypothetical protein VMR98_03530, partial [Candidatus Polarisedimenticolaceae bacterium]|nr:hypothetical protein [Candidatus Polarisedimenticolaceae bacterium]